MNTGEKFKGLFKGVSDTSVGRAKAIATAFIPTPIGYSVRTMNRGDRVIITDECCRTINFAVSLNLWVKLLKAAILSLFAMLSAFIGYGSFIAVPMRLLAFAVTLLFAYITVAIVWHNLEREVSLGKYLLVRRLIYGIYAFLALGSVYTTASVFYGMLLPSNAGQYDMRHIIFAVSMSIGFYVFYVSIFKQIYYGLSLCEIVPAGESRVPTQQYEEVV